MMGTRFLVPSLSVGPGLTSIERHDARSELSGSDQGSQPLGGGGAGRAGSRLAMPIARAALPTAHFEKVLGGSPLPQLSPSVTNY